MEAEAESRATDGPAPGPDADAEGGTVMMSVSALMSAACLARWLAVVHFRPPLKVAALWPAPSTARLGSVRPAAAAAAGALGSLCRHFSSSRVPLNNSVSDSRALSTIKWPIPTLPTHFHADLL